MDKNCAVTFFPSEHTLMATIDTPRLHMRSIEEKDLSFYTDLFSNAQVLEKFGLPGINPPLYVKKRVYEWRTHWNKKSPYSAFTIFKKEMENPLGYIAAEEVARSGHIELSIAFMPPFWRQGFGSEAINALVNTYLPSTVAKRSLLKEIIAITRSDNIASIRLFQKILSEKKPSLSCETEIRFFTSN